ncbi:hypothetical protein RCO27_04315 [Sphingosinicella sp. LHD-64]|uniref:hypothetical protein n=1 Tax=Sphingosinicella sp. LHD-64 TaxID=3072139 RepID=UPI00280D6A6C|nr:hypothetical protein [Sphingosinicella sp. LHD-64]MDQ8755446.1 hypothetical protein [Sphingosinicella sp. LHD-64]
MPLLARLLPARRPVALAGLAQSKHTGPLDSDTALEAQIRNVRDGPGKPVSGKSRGLSVPARAWIAVGAAALLWVIIAVVLALIS